MNKDLLPSSFVEKMRELLGQELEDYLRSLEEDWNLGLRVNLLKISPQKLMDLVPWEMEPVPWVREGFCCGGEADRPSRHPAYFAGLYYLQEPSAMAPAALLDAAPGERVLDLCAAPGGKSTQLGAALQGQGLLVSNDVSPSRARALVKNLELFGVENCLVTAEEPEKLAQIWPEYFDKILVDAPCSGEGMFRKNPEMVREWTKRGPEYYAPIQRRILKNAVEMVRPGGRVFYSTCTFSPEEDEETIQAVLDQFPQVQLVPLTESQVPGGVKSRILPGCMRLFPHRVRGEGHFLALLEKKGEPKGQTLSAGAGMGQGRKKEEPLPEFLSQTKGIWGTGRKGPEDSRILRRQDSLYLLPEGMNRDSLPSLRFMRTGLLLGEERKGRFEPSQALAMALKKEGFLGARLDLDLDDPRVVRYLKGETVMLNPQEEPDGDWVLVCVQGYPLGWARKGRSMLKNKYAPGWRWQ